MNCFCKINLFRIWVSGDTGRRFLPEARVVLEQMKSARALLDDAPRAPLRLMGRARSRVKARARLEDLAAKEGLTLDDKLVSPVLHGNEAVREAVQAGVGATIISEHVVASAIAAGRLKAQPIDLPPRDFAVLRHRDRRVGAAARALMQHLAREEAKR